MILKIKVVPRVITGKTIPEVLIKIRQHASFASTMQTIGFVHLNGNNDIVVYNIVKVNAKRIRTKDKYIIKEPAKVTAYVYTFNNDFLRLSGLRVKQNRRNFELMK